MEDGECPQCGTCSPVRRNGTHPLPFSGSPVTSISGLLPSSLRPQATACLPSSSGSSGTMPFSSQCFPLGHTKGPTTCPVCWQQPHQEPHHSLRESWYLLCGCCVFLGLSPHLTLRSSPAKRTVHRHLHLHKRKPKRRDWTSPWVCPLHHSEGPLGSKVCVTFFLCWGPLCSERAKVHMGF